MNLGAIDWSNIDEARAAYETKYTTGNITNISKTLHASFKNSFTSLLPNYNSDEITLRYYVTEAFNKTDNSKDCLAYVLDKLGQPNLIYDYYGGGEVVIDDPTNSDKKVKEKEKVVVTSPTSVCSTETSLFNKLKCQYNNNKIVKYGSWVAGALILKKIIF